MLLLAIVLIGSAAALGPGVGPCRDIALKKDVDIDKLLGKWYEYKHYYNSFDLHATCVSVTVTKDTNGTVGLIFDRLLDYNGKRSIMEGKLDKNQPHNTTGKTMWLFPFKPFYEVPVPFWLVETDYDSFAVVYACYEVGIVNFQTAWVYTRDRHPKQSVLDKAFHVFYVNGIDLYSTQLTSQDNCPND